MVDKTHVIIKGIKNGILVELTEELASQIDAKQSFFAGANVTVNVGARPVPKYELTSLKALLDKRGLTIWSIMSDSETTIEAAHALDLKTNVANTVPTRPDAHAPAPEQEESGEISVVVRRTLRSGQQVRSPGHAIVIGDVNPGAEVIAAGNVIVWGRLRGIVHAGFEGDESAVVCALDMSPTQLRIAGHIVTSPDDVKRQPQPEVAHVRDQQIIVETWR
jgi:septum site-determining protein MinC